MNKYKFMQIEPINSKTLFQMALNFCFTLKKPAHFFSFT